MRKELLGFVLLVAVLALFAFYPYKETVQTYYNETPPDSYSSVGGSGELGLENGEPIVEINPTIVRNIKVIRDGEVIAEYEKVGDPFTKVWHMLVANWMFGLYYSQTPFTIPTVSGASEGWFDTYAYGLSSLKFYVSGDASQVSYSATTLPQDVINGIISASVDGSNSQEYMWVVTGTYSHSGQPYTVRAIYLTLQTNNSSGVQIEYLILADVVNPEITLNDGDVLAVTWYVKFPNTEPYTPNFIELVGYFLGTTEPMSITPDFGRDYSNADYVKETVIFRFFDQNNNLLGETQVSGVNVLDDPTGLTVSLETVYTATSQQAISKVVVALQTDVNPNTWRRTAGYYEFLSITLQNPVVLDVGEVVIIRLNVSMPNQFP